MNEGDGGGGDSAGDLEPAEVANLSQFNKHLKKTVFCLLEEDEQLGDKALQICFDDRIYEECIRKFIADQQINTLLIQRNCNKGKFNRNLISRRRLLIALTFKRKLLP